MRHNSILIISFLGTSAISYAVYADVEPSSNVLDTITLQAQQQTNESHSTASTKFNHDEIDIPFSRSYLSQSMLKQQDVQRIEDAVGLVSGVFSQNNYGGGFWDNYSIRGFATDPNLSAATIRNGLSVNRGLAAPRDMVNIESMEFLKGPAAALYGRGEMGGLLNINAKKPQWQPQGQVYLRADTDEKYRGSFEYTAPINDQLAYRFAIAHEDNQSFRDYVNSERWFFSPQLSWIISDQTKLNFDSEITRQKGLFDRGISAYQGQILMDRKTYTGEPSADINRVNDQFYQLHLEHQFNDDWTLNSAASYKQGKIAGSSNEPRRFDVDGETLNRQRRQRYTYTSDRLAQTELLGKIDTSWARHEILIAAEAGKLVFNQDQLRCDYTYSGARFCENKINVYNPIYGVYLPNMGLQSDTHESQEYAALNLQDQMFFNDQWSLLLGTRFDRVKQQQIDYRANSASSKTFNEASPRIGLNYKINPALSVYTNYGRSFAMNTGVDAQSNAFAPEKGESYEIGSKYQINDQSMLSLALFQMQKRNVLTTDPVDIAYQRAAGEAKSSGVEMTLQSELTPKLNLLANYTYTDAQITQDTYIAKGTRLNSVPRNNANLSLEYKLINEINQKAGVGGNWVYVDKRNGTQNVGLELPTYSLVNLNAYYEPNQQLRYQININNLFDKTYYVESYSDMWIQPGNPLNASLSVLWKF